jgi:hypothetical protein
MRSDEAVARDRRLDRLLAPAEILDRLLDLADPRCQRRHFRGSRRVGEGKG